MPKGNIDDQLAFNRKILAAGNEAVGAWVRMISLSNAQLTDGVLTDEQVSAIASTRCVERLLRSALMHRVEGGVRIHDFHDWNLSREQVIAQRNSEKLRKAALRAKKERQTPFGVPSSVRAGVPPGREPASEDPLPLPLSPSEKEEEEKSAALRDKDPDSDPDPPERTSTDGASGTKIKAVPETVPELTEEQIEICDVLATGLDVFPGVTDREIAVAAIRIADEVSREDRPPLAADVAAEAVAWGRVEKRRRPKAEPPELFAMVERKVGYLLRDSRPARKANALVRSVKIA